MVDGGRRCALPGCDAPIEIVPGRPERRYCTAAHRAAARQARRLAGAATGRSRFVSDAAAQARFVSDAAAQAGLVSDAAAQAGLVSDAAAQARLAEALPWVRRPAAELVLAGVPARAGHADPATAPGPPRRDAGQAVGPGPAQGIGLAPPGPAPQPAAVPVDLGWLYEPPTPARRRLRLPSVSLPSVSLPSISLPTVRRAARRPRPPRPARSARHRRALAAISAAGLILAGYSLTASEPDPGVTSPAALAVPELTDEQQWADRAAVALASVNAQLDLIAQSEVAWSRLPDAVKAARPDVLQRLLERKAYLEAQKALLQSQLANFEALRRSADTLRATEQDIARIERTLTVARSGGAPAAAVAGLEASRATQQAGRDATRRELEARRAGIADATRTPLPEDPTPTTRATDEVEAVVAGAEHPAPPPDPALQHRPAAVQGREQDPNPAAQVDVSGPPDPRGPGDRSVDDESSEPAAASDSEPAGRHTDASEDSGSTESKEYARSMTPGYSHSFSDTTVDRIDEARADQGYGPLDTAGGSGADDGSD